VKPIRTLLTRQMHDLVRGRAIAGYASFVGLATWGLLHFGGGPDRALPSLATLVVLVVPLVSILITTAFLYQGGDFIELILSHPVGRKPLFVSMYVGLVTTLIGAFLVGALVPFLIVGIPVGDGGAVGLMLTAGALLTAVFTSLGFLIVFRVADPAKGNGVALLVWLTMAVLYDGGVLYAAYRWAAYPLETPMLLLMALNPVDVARVLVIMALDASAMMGYTGAVFQEFFGSGRGTVLAIGCLLLWTVVPGLAALRSFMRKDL